MRPGGDKQEFLRSQALRSLLPHPHPRAPANSPAQGCPLHPLLTLRCLPGPEPEDCQRVRGCAVCLPGEPVSNLGWSRRQPAPIPGVCLSPGVTLCACDLCLSVCDHLSECVFLCITVDLSRSSELVSVCVCLLPALGFLLSTSPTPCTLANTS